ncbi:nuclear receptor coactivator 5-like isoform X2 [Patiria miniata]|uniref:RRM domain-containing protein n=1 Tax=Patiria miniata TaxID=46514 RepID=A0A914AYG1_PATMI|nr:nuclear receptor coactivator 5-like isoform X2 [Patiria miniata]
MRDSDLPPNARLHIAQLSETANKENLRARFEKYGTIYEIYVNTNKGFGFIQYASAAEAAKAIAAENTSFFEGKHIGVRLAQKDRFGNTINTDDRGRPAASRGQDPFLDRDRDRERDRDLDRYRERDLPLRDLPLRGRERSPHRDRYDDRYYDKFERGRDLYERDREDARRRDQFFEDRLPPVRDRYDDLYPPEDDYRREAVFRDRERDRDRDRERDRRDPLERGRSRDILDRDILDRDILDRDIRERDVRERDILERDSLPRDSRDAYDRRAPRHPEPALIDPLPPVSAPPPLPSAEKPIDCEILLMGKHLRDYADLVERRVKALSLNTGLLLIANESSLTQALEDVTRRKVLYAIILTSQNEVHRSVTLNILHGSPQEHRNMPLEDALALVDRNFSTYLQDRAVPVKSSSSSAPAAPMAPLPGEPPLPKSQPPLPPTPQPPAPPAAPTALAIPAVELTIPQLINLLADRKQLTLSEMDRVISHLQAVRRKMAIEQGLNPDPPAVASSAPAPTITKSVQQPIVTPAVAPAPAKPVDPKQAELQAKILSIFNPSGSSSTAAATSAANRTTMATAPQPVSRPSMAASFLHGGSLSSVNASQAAKAAPTSKSAGDINFDSPVVQKVLDKLILSGPTMLKKLATSANGTASISTFSRTQASNSKGIKDPKSQSRVTPKAGLSRQDSDAQLRAAQQAALKTLQQQENATMTVQSNMTRQIPPTPAAVMQNQYPPGMVQYPQPAQYQQQQAVYQQQQQAAYQQQQQQPMVQYPQQQYQQPNMQQQQPLATSPTPLLPDPIDKKGRGWPRGWNPPGVQSTGGQQTGHQQGFQSSAQPNLQQNPHMNQNSRASYQQQQQNRGYLGNRSQPKPPGI